MVVGRPTYDESKQWNSTLAKVHIYNNEFHMGPQEHHFRRL